MSKKSIIALSAVVLSMVIGAALALTGINNIEAVRGGAASLVIIGLLMLFVPEGYHDKYGEQSRKMHPPPLVPTPPVSPNRQIEVLSNFTIGSKE